MPILSWVWQSEEETVMEYTNTEIEKVIDDYIHSERDRSILKRRLIDGVCYEPLAEEFDLSVRQIKCIVYKGEDKIFSHLQSFVF